MTSRSLLLALLISALLAFHAVSVSSAVDLDEEDFSFLEEDDDDDMDHHDDDEGTDDASVHESVELRPFDERDVVVLGGGNFSEFVKGNRHVMVEFYVPWCPHCKSLAPEYADAATELRGDDVTLTKIDGSKAQDLSKQYDVHGLPTLLFFVDGVQIAYPGERTKDAIVTWIKKRISPSIHNITTTEEAEKILAAESKVVLGFLDSLVGHDSQELTAASKLDDDVSFYQTVNPNVAELFHIDPNAKRPYLVMVKKEEEKLTYFDGQFTKSVIVDFVLANKLSSVISLTRESAQLIFDNPIKKQILLFATSNGSEKVIPTFQDVAKLFKGRLIFIYVEIDNEDMGKPMAEYLGVTGDGPKVLAFRAENDDVKKHVLDSEVTFDNIKKFAEDFIEDKLKRFYKSEPIPQINDGDLKIVVGHNFDEIVLDESKDVLLNVYASWCGFCKALAPTYKKLAKRFRGIESLVIAKMDGIMNEHPRVKFNGFPTLFFFPAGNKSSDPITVETNRTVVAFYKFIKEHASVPFKLQKSAPVMKPVTVGDAATPERETGAGSNVKDEL